MRRVPMRRGACSARGTLARPELSWVPPLRDGVSASRVGVGGWPVRGPGGPKGGGNSASLLDFLSARFPAVGDWAARLARGDVLDQTGRPMSADAPCVPGMLLWYWRSPPPEPRVPFEIEVLHQDEHLVVVDKPHFLSVTPGGRHLRETVLVRLRQQLGISTLAPMHRLDRDTAGVLVFIVQPSTRNAYHALLRERQVVKVYEAIAPWRAGLAWPLTCHSRLVQPTGTAFMQMQVVDGEPNAETRIELIEHITAVDSSHHFDGYFAPHAAPCLGRYRLMPITGRTHQLRVQMSALGLPILGDRIYPRLMPNPEPDAMPDYSQPLQLLARELSFTDPISGLRRRFTSRRQLCGQAQQAPLKCR